MSSAIIESLILPDLLFNTLVGARAHGPGVQTAVGLVNSLIYGCVMAAIWWVIMFRCKTGKSSSNRFDLLEKPDIGNKRNTVLRRRRLCLGAVSILIAAGLLLLGTLFARDTASLPRHARPSEFDRKAWMSGSIAEKRIAAACVKSTGKLVGKAYQQVIDLLGNSTGHVARYALMEGASQWRNDWFLSIVFDEDGFVDCASEWGQPRSLPVSDFNIEDWYSLSRTERLPMLRTLARVHGGLSSDSSRAELLATQGKEADCWLLIGLERGAMIRLLGEPDYELLSYAYFDGKTEVSLSIHLTNGKVSLVGNEAY